MSAHLRLGMTVLALVVSMASMASAQRRWPSTPWQTVAGGDASGDRIDVALVENAGDLTGTRRVARIDAPSGYTTGTSVTIVLEGTEAEPSRSLRAHLPYGAQIDLAVGDVVDVRAHAVQLGLGSRQEIQVTRGEDVILFTTSMPSAGGITVARGTAGSSDRTRHVYGLRVTIGGRVLAVAPSTLVHLAQRSLLVQGSEVVYDGSPRPPDAFDSRSVTMVRIRPPAP
jgi:hypothetical protein